MNRGYIFLLMLVCFLLVVSNIFLLANGFKKADIMNSKFNSIHERLDALDRSFSVEMGYDAE